MHEYIFDWPPSTVLEGPPHIVAKRYPDFKPLRILPFWCSSCVYTPDYIMVNYKNVRNSPLIER